MYGTKNCLDNLDWKSKGQSVDSWHHINLSLVSYSRQV
jgi:hypothetical protein